MRLRRALEGYPEMMLRFIGRVYGPSAIDEAWSEFILWEEEAAFDPETPHLEVFMPWFFHRWAPDPATTAVIDVSLNGRVPTGVLLERRGYRLRPVLRRYLEACVDAPFSFHEVLRVDPGKGLRTKDVLTREEHEILERSASQSLQVGNVVFAQLVTADDITVMEACGPVAIPPREKLRLIDLREHIAADDAPVDAATLHDWDIEIREIYLDVAEALLNPAPPRLQNTDGEELVWHRLHFEVDEPREAFDALKGLALDDEEELLEEADMDADGGLRAVSFNWTVAGNRVHAGWENTVHGNIDIDGRDLRAEVNSAERAARLQRIVEERLGDGARHVRTEVLTMDEAMADRSEGGWAGPAGADAGRLPEDDPAVLEAIRKVMASHYESWPSQPLPALDGLTPLEAVETPAGREKVDALITDMEHASRGSPGQVDAELLGELRTRLGLS